MFAWCRSCVVVAGCEMRAIAHSCRSRRHSVRVSKIQVRCESLLFLLLILFTTNAVTHAQDPRPAAAPAEPPAASKADEGPSAVSGDVCAETVLRQARSQARAGNAAGAFETLDHAVNDGYLDRRDADDDPDLRSLHKDPRWQQLIDRMDKLAAQQDTQWNNAAFAAPGTVDLTDGDKMAGLSELWAQAKFDFANFWHVPSLDWDKTYRDFIPKVLATRSAAQYYRVLQQFYAELQDGHSNVYPPDQLNISPMPLHTRLVDGHLLVLGATRRGFDLQGVHPGDEILSINGENAISWARRNVEPLVSASTQQDRDNRTFGSDLFRTREGTSFTLTISTPSGTHSTHTFTVPPYVASDSAPFELRMLGGGIAHVALNSFEGNVAAEEWDRHWPEISKANGIILDLRENGGGNDTVGYHILATIIDKPAPDVVSRYTRWVATYKAWGIPETPVRSPSSALKPDPSRHFSGPVVLLISPRTFSAAEDVVAVFKQAHRGSIIGEPTAGSTGQPLFFPLPGGGKARICTKHDSFADGSEFVGVGIQPDIAAHLTREDIVSGHDSVLALAVRSLGRNAAYVRGAAPVRPE